MRLPVQEFKQFDRYFIGDKVCASKKDQISDSDQVVPLAKSKTKKKSRGEKRKTTEQLRPKPFPKAFGQKLISDTVKDMDKESEMFDFEDDSRLQRLYQPARMRYEEKISSHESTATASELPQLPSLLESKSLLNEEIETQETMKITIQRQNIAQESQTPILAFDFNKALEKDSVVTSQPTSSIGLLSSKSQDEGNILNFEDVPRNAPVSMDVIYLGMPMVPMAKGVANFLTDPDQENIAQVHKSCSKVDQMDDTYVTVEVDASQQVIEQATAESDTKRDDDDDDNDEEENVLEVKRFAKLVDDPNREIISIPQHIDTSKIAPAVPLAEQLVGYEYCTMCSSKFKGKRYLKIHMTCLCPFLTIVERVQCRLCGKIYIQDKTYRDHLTKHTKVARYQCPRCGKKFEHQNSRFRHSKFCK